MQLFKLSTKRRNRINTYFLCLIAATLPFFVNVGNAAVILAISFNIIFFQKTSIIKMRSFKFWFPAVFFIITVISGLFSKNNDLGLKHLDLTLLILLIAVILVNSNITKAVVNKVMNALFIGSVIGTLILILNAIFKLLKKVNLGDISFHNFTQLYDQHPVYYSMFISLSLVYSIFSKHQGRKQVLKNRSLYFVSLIILLGGLVLCASKAVLVLNMVIFMFYYIFKIRNKRKKITYLFIFIIFSFIIYNVPFIKNRFNDGIRLNETIAEFQPTNDFSKKKLFNYEEKVDISDLELRIILAKIGVYHIIKDKKILFGYGQGDTKNHLNYYYYSYNLGPNWYEDFNIHNQYLHIFITYGIFTFLFFMAYLVYSFKAALLNRDSLHLYFLLLSGFVFIFEVALVRNKGIIFFYFLNSLFLFNPKHFESSNIRN
jgi:hypothetical protein